MKNEVTELRNTSRIKQITKAVIFAYILTLIMILIYSVVLAFTNVSDSTMPIVVTLISMFSILISTVIFCRQIATSGLVNGCVISGIYIGLMYLLNSLFVVGFALNGQSVVMIITVIALGSIGGIIGVNFSRLQR